jgi:hypothetical protein
VGLGLGDGDGEGDGDGPGDGDGDGLAPPTSTSTEAVAADVPALACRVKRVVEAGRTSSDPFAFTTPTPLSIETESAPSTSHCSVAVPPAAT